MGATEFSPRLLRSATILSIGRRLRRAGGAGGPGNNRCPTIIPASAGPHNLRRPWLRPPQARGGSPTDHRRHRHPPRPRLRRPLRRRCVASLYGECDFGALGLPDIGQIFPDIDPRWMGAASSVFLGEAVRLMHEAGYELGNLDATLILQGPKLSPHTEAIRGKLCDHLGADPPTVNLKAKAHEKVDL